MSTTVTRPIAWLVTCEVPAELHKAEEAARAQSALDRIIVDTATAKPGGVETVRTVRHLLADYFSAVKVDDAGMLGNNNEFRLFFYPALNADKYWRDLMVGILRSIEKSASGVSIRSLRQ